jgi:hypothetical protein
MAWKRPTRALAATSRIEMSQICKLAIGFGTTYCLTVPNNAFSEVVDTCILDALNRTYQAEVAAFFQENDPDIAYQRFVYTLCQRMETVGSVSV